VAGAGVDRKHLYEMSLFGRLRLDIRQERQEIENTNKETLERDPGRKQTRKRRELQVQPTRRRDLSTGNSAAVYQVRGM
jgi:hypothetical protein